MKTLQYLDAVKKRLNITSDYALAQHLDLTRSAVSKLQQGKVSMGDDTALKVAQILELNPLEVIAAANAERAKTPEMRAVWTGLMDRVTQGFRTLLPRADLGLRIALT